MILATLPSAGPVLAGIIVALLVTLVIRHLRRPRYTHPGQTKGAPFQEVGGSADGVVSDEQWANIQKLAERLREVRRRNSGPIDSLGSPQENQALRENVRRS